MHIPYILPNGDKIWSKDTIFHRVGGPALVMDNGDYIEYKRYGERHRIEGAAVQWSNHKEYWQFGEKHRVKGPAVIWDTGDKEYWLRGKKLI